MLRTNTVSLYISAAHLKASDDDHRVNIKLCDAQTNVLHDLLWQRSL